MINFNEALTIAENEFKTLSFESEEVHLLDSLNRILAEDILSDLSFPPFNSSAMDGIAVRFSESVNQWEIIGEISAGNYKEFNISKRTCVYITTGSKVPDSADTVIPVEDLIVNGNTAVLNSDAKLKFRQNVRIKGEDLETGKIAVNKNTLLKSRHIAAAAACGKSTVNVLRKPGVGVLASGDEIIDIDSIPEDDKIRGSNMYSILSAVNESGMEAVNLGMIRDDREQVKNALQNALKSDIDIILTTGGISAGKYDFIDDIFAELGIEIKFAKVNIKPGKPVVFGIYNKGDKKKLILGLPGNPVSCLVNFILFARLPYEKIFGNVYPVAIKAVLENDIKKKDGKRHFVRAILYNKDGETFAGTTGMQSSGDLFSMANANCLIIIEEGRTNPKKGEEVKCIMM